MSPLLPVIDMSTILSRDILINQCFWRYRSVIPKGRLRLLDILFCKHSILESDTGFWQQTPLCNVVKRVG